jgi:BirA family biotin operon repressor/biotin-[acetyl-CoA-carboxylase] ligase
VSDRTDTELLRLKAALGEYSTRFDADLLESCSSTNSLLLERATRGAPSGSVLWTLEQTAGRGRRGREWISTAGDSLTFSLLWRFDSSISLDGLSLVAGLAVVDALSSFGVAGLALKWPNDVWLDGRKLCGLLVELQQSGSRVGAVVGIGINLRLPAEALRLDQPVAALGDALSPPADAAEVLAAVLIRLAIRFERFASEGFAGQREDWLVRNGLAGQAVRLIEDDGETQGICAGVDQDGALLLRVGSSVRRVLGGDVSLRRAAR